MTYAYPSTINPGYKSPPSNVFITYDAVKNATETCGFSLQWRGTNGTDQSVQTTGYPAQDGGSSYDNGTNGIIMNILIRSMTTERE